MASSVPLVNSISLSATPKNEASSGLACVYSGYIESTSAVRCVFRNSTTAGEQPTVFSLKSSRRASFRPSAGGEYGAICTTDSRGLGIADLDGACVPFQAFGTRERGDRRRELS